MTIPRVYALMLVHQRPDLALRALRCFESQTYENKRLIVMDTTVDGISELGSVPWRHYGPPQKDPLISNIGALRNAALGLDPPGPGDIVIHFDYDDWSHPERIARQVQHLQASDKPITGYREMLFWRTDQQARVGVMYAEVDEAWRYLNDDPAYVIGTSLCYWARTWQAAPFPVLRSNRGSGEDREFCRIHGSQGDLMHPDQMIIASQHGSNTSTLIVPDSPNWKRVPEYDSLCLERMSL